MANAAEDTIEWVRKSVEWAESQYYATVGEIVALIITIGVATIAVCAAFGANRIARKSAERQLRAYVAIDEIQTTPISNAPGSDWQISLIWKNTGATFARRLQTHLAWRDFPQEMPPDFDYPDGPIEERNAPGVLGPQLSQFDWPIVIPQHTLQELQAKHCRVYLWAWAEYSDVFDGTPRHRTEVCYELILHAPRKAGGKLGIGHHIYGEFNGDDDDCHHKPKT